MHNTRYVFVYICIYIYLYLRLYVHSFPCAFEFSFYSCNPCRRGPGCGTRVGECVVWAGSAWFLPSVRCRTNATPKKAQVKIIITQKKKKNKKISLFDEDRSSLWCSLIMINLVRGTKLYEEGNVRSIVIICFYCYTIMYLLT